MLVALRHSSYVLHVLLPDFSFRSVSKRVDLVPMANVPRADLDFVKSAFGRDVCSGDTKGFCMPTALFPWVTARSNSALVTVPVQTLNPRAVAEGLDRRVDPQFI